MIDDKPTQVLLDRLSRKSPNAKNASGIRDQGSMIGDMFVVAKIIVVTFLYFFDPDKAHRSSTIDNFFESFINVYPSRILLMPKGINYLLKLHVNNLCKKTPPLADVNGDRHSTTVVNEWFLYLLEFFFRHRT
jgi:hypothetical protein